MIATPTFTAPISDLLTKDRIRSSRDSRITSSRGPLWVLAYDGPLRERLFTIADVIADDMGIIVRAQRPALVLRPYIQGVSEAETVGDVGGTANAIWLATYQGLRSVRPESNVNAYIHELSPVDFTVRRRHRVHTSKAVLGMDGDNDVIYMVFVDVWGTPGEWSLWKLNAATFGVLGTARIADSFVLRGLAGDENGVWIGGEAQDAPVIREYTSDLTFVETRPWPFVDIGHEQGTLGGSSQRIYCTTRVVNTLPDWPVGYYIHTIKPSDFSVIRTYGPWVSSRANFANLVGGM